MTKAISLRIAAPLAVCGTAALWLAVSPTFAEQDWIPVVSLPGVDTGRFVEGPVTAPVPSGGWDPLVLMSAEQSSTAIDRTVRRTPLPQPRLLTPVSASAVGAATDATPSTTTAPSTHPAPLMPPERARKPQPEAGPAQQYCINIADAAADARFAWQKKTLGEIEQELDRRIALLEARTAEYREWLARRDEFARKAQETLVKIYARMRPDAAASQLAAMDEETAAAVLTKLDARNASAILNEMPAGPAARLTTTIAGAGRISPDPVSGAVAAPKGGKS